MRTAVVALLIGLLVPLGARAQDPVPTADELIENVASTWDPLRVRLVATMTVRQPERPELETRLLIRRAGSGLTRVDFLHPEKDVGKALLQHGDQTWLYLPRTGRVVEIPAKRNPLAGGVLFEDLFPGREALSGDSTVEVTDAGFVLVTRMMRGRQNTRPAGTSRILFDRSTRLPSRREVYASSGRLLKTVEIEKLGDWEGAKIPWIIRFEDHLRQGGEARIEVVEAATLTPEEEALVSLERLGEP